MKVYLVYGGFDYEGEDGDSIRVFSSEEKAELYREKLRKDSCYGYVALEEREVDAE